MIMSTEFNPKRLDIARRRRGITKTALAKAVGISQRSWYLYSSGAATPPEDTLGRFAQVLEFPVAFFSGPDLEEPPTLGSSFRSRSTMSASQRDRAIAAGALALALSDWIDARFELPAPNVPTYRDVDPETAAEAVREEWSIGQLPLGNFIHLLESNGVRVFSLAEDPNDIDAFSFWREDVPFIFLNRKKSAEHQRMDLSHELGHLVMHSSVEQIGREGEKEAQSFGAAFLMPRGSVLAAVRPGTTLPSIIRLKEIWGVSVANLTYRLRTLTLLNDWQYRDTFVEISRRGYRTTEPNQMPVESSQVFQKVFDLVAEGGETIGSMARQLTISIDELSRLVFGIATSPMPVPSRWSLKAVG